MTDVEKMIEGVRKAKALLIEQGAIPSRVEVTSEQFEVLKKHLNSIGSYPTNAVNSILGLRIVINDHPHR